MSKEHLRRWLQAFVLAGTIAIIFSLYLFVRRGYYNTYIINKVAGSTAAVVAGLILVVGPITHRWNKLTQLLLIRKELGLLSLGAGLTHFILSFFVLRNRFPVEWYKGELIPVLAGLIALVVWLYLAVISYNQKLIQRLAHIWKRHQQLGGQFAFIAVYIHLTVMKYSGWMRWLNGQVKATPELENPGYPPASIFVFLIMTGIILFRVVMTLLHKRELQRQAP
jgi:hypothetical protein